MTMSVYDHSLTYCGGRKTRTMSKKPKANPAAPDRDVLVEIASMLTRAHIEIARAAQLAKTNGLVGITVQAELIGQQIRREAAVALGSATKGDG